MKQKLYIASIIITLVLLTGLIFKVQHYPGAGILITLGIAAMNFYVLPAGLINNYRNSEKEAGPLLHIVIWLTCFVVFTAMLFKVQHWPGAGIGLLIALPFPYLVFLPVYLIVTSRKSSHNIYDTIMVLVLLTINSVFSALLAVNAVAQVVK